MRIKVALLIQALDIEKITQLRDDPLGFIGELELVESARSRVLFFPSQVNVKGIFQGAMHANTVSI